MIANKLIVKILVLFFFLFSIYGVGVSQSMDSIAKIEFNKVAMADGFSILDSIRQIERSTTDSLEIVLRRVEKYKMNIVFNRASKIDLQKPNMVIPAIPSVVLQEVKKYGLEYNKALTVPKKILGEQSELIKEKVDPLFKDVGDITSGITDIGRVFDSLKSIQNIDSTLLNVQELGVGKVEQEMLERKELSILSENSGIVPHYSEALGNELIAGNVSGLRILDPKQIQQDYFQDLGKIGEAQTHLEKYKDKYSELSDSRVEKGGVKRHSLKDRPFLERGEVGLFGHFSSFNPFVFQVSTGYRIDRRWTAGAGAIGSIGWKHPGPKWNGIKAFGQYWFRESFFVQTEYQTLSNGRTSTEAKLTSRSAFLGGLGTEVQVYRSIRLRSTVLYRFNQWDTLLQGFESPWQASVGIVYKK